MCAAGTSGDERDPYVWLRELGPSAPEVQLQQSDADGYHHWPFTPERNREGRIDADRVIDALGEGGTQQCTLILEVIPAFEQNDDSVLDNLARSVDYWREALTRSGVAADTDRLRHREPPSAAGCTPQRGEGSCTVLQPRSRLTPRPGPVSRRYLDELT
jgi:hypothetical protein